MITQQLVESSRWPVKALGDVVDFLDSQRRPVTENFRARGEYTYYGANGPQGTIDQYLFDESTILLAEDGGFFGQAGRTVAYQVDGRYWVNNHAHVLRPRAEADIRFLCRQLEYYDLTPFVNGTTRAKLTKGNAERIPVALPPLVEQKRIAAILDKADAIRRRRQEAARLADTLIPSVFYEMFGDSVLNRKGWPTRPLGDMLDFLTSGSRGWAAFYANSGRMFRRIQNVGRNRLLLDDVQYVQVEDSAESRRTATQAGDVLVTVTADLGRTAVIPEGFGPAHINQHIVLLRSTQIEPLFLSQFLASPAGQRQFTAKNRAAVKAGLNFDDIKSVKIVTPPRPLQKKFAQACLRIERFAADLVGRQEASDTFFNALVQRAFRGEL